MSQAHLLIIEDDLTVCELLTSCLNSDVRRLTVAHSGEDGLRVIEEDPPALVVLDLNLPGMNGLDVCRTMRREPWMNQIPVLMLTGQSEEDDMVVGLETGADDYMTKPFSTKLLNARVNALLRRQQPGEDAAAGRGEDEPELTPETSRPQLLIIKTLGHCELQRGGQAVKWAEAFSPAQRQLLSLLVASPDAQIPQEEVQLAFWPDSSSSRARSSFDSLLSRVRRSLEERLTDFDSKQYLVVRRGILHLENVRVDAHEFIRMVEKGLKQAAVRNLWQAEIALSSALSLWQGTFLPGDFGTDAAVIYQDELEQLYMEASQALARILAESGRYQEAAKLLRYAQRYNPGSDELARLLYQLQLAQDHHGQARQVLSLYTQALEREKFTAAEIDSIIADFPQAPPRNGWI